MGRFQGIFPMLPTPFSEDGELLLSDYVRLVAYVTAHAPSGLAMLGLASEVRTLSIAERKAVVETVAGLRSSSIPLLVGVSADTTAESIQLAHHAQQHGVAILMIAPPAAPGISDNDLLAHYVAVAEAAPDADIMVQDAPHEVGVRLSAELIARLTGAAHNILYAKMEGAPVGQSIVDVRAESDQLGFAGGNGGLFYMDVLDAGIVGMIPSCEALGAVTTIYQRYHAGDRVGALALYRECLPLWVFENQNGAIFNASVKVLLHREGVLTSARTRVGPPLSDWSVRALLRHADPLLHHPAI